VDDIKIKPNQDIAWTPAETAAVLDSAFTAGTASAYKFNILFFTRATNTESLPLYA